VVEVCSTAGALTEVGALATAGFEGAEDTAGEDGALEVAASTPGKSGTLKFSCFTPPV